MLLYTLLVLFLDSLNIVVPFLTAGSGGAGVELQLSLKSYLKRMSWYSYRSGLVTVSGCQPV